MCNRASGHHPDVARRCQASGLDSRVTARVSSPDGQAYQVIALIELRDGLVYRETVYWAPPFDAPEWRRPFVERVDGSRADSA
jgi:hypothetical protein